MIKPKPFKWVCKKCGYSKSVTPESDVLDFRDFINTCPKCGNKMEREDVNILDSIKGIFTK